MCAAPAGLVRRGPTRARQSATWERISLYRMCAARGEMLQVPLSTKTSRPKSLNLAFPSSTPAPAPRARPRIQLTKVRPVHTKFGRIIYAMPCVSSVRILILSTLPYPVSSVVRRRSLDARTAPRCVLELAATRGTCAHALRSTPPAICRHSVAHAGSGNAIACRTPSMSISAAFSAVRGCAMTGALRCGAAGTLAVPWLRVAALAGDAS